MTGQMEYRFRRGRKETNAGILIFKEKFEFLVNRINKEMTTFWYYCKHRKTKGIMCGAKATVIKVDDEKFVLSKITEEHSHPGSACDIIVEDMKAEMCDIVETFPENPVGEARKATLLKYAEIYDGNQDLWADIVSKLGDYDALDKRLLRARQKIIGKSPTNRNEFDPSLVLGVDDDVIILDSNNLPEGWKEDMENISEISNLEAENENLEEGDNEDANILPKRVFVFTSPKLLKLFEENDGKASVDGTFKAIPTNKCLFG